MTWQQATVTKQGLALQAKLIDGKTLRFTKVVSGAGTVDKGALADATAVTDERQTLTLQPPNTLEGARIRVPVLLNNIGLQTGYQMHQIGFYAADPDEGEILYAIAQDDAGDRIPSETEARGFAADWVYVFEFGNAESVDVQLDPAGLLSVGLLGKPGGVAQLDDTGALPIAQGGTGATTNIKACENLGAVYCRPMGAAQTLDELLKCDSGFSYVIPPATDMPHHDYWNCIVWSDGRSSSQQYYSRLILAAPANGNELWKMNVTNGIKTSWIKLMSTSLPQEFDLELTPGWSGTAKYYKTQNGICIVQLDCTKNNVIQTGEVLATLPAGCRPAYSMHYPITLFGPHGSGVININTNGQIVFGDMTAAQSCRVVYSDITFVSGGQE